MVLIWVDKGYPSVRFEYKTGSDWYLVAEFKQNSFRKKFRILSFTKDTQNSFDHNWATKYCSEAVLYLKRMAGYP